MTGGRIPADADSFKRRPDQFPGGIFFYRDKSMVPFTYYMGFDDLTPEQRVVMLDEFAVSGGKNLVLTDSLLAQFCGSPKLRKVVYQQIENAGLKLIDAHAPFGPECDLMLPDDMRQLGMARQRLVLEFVREAGVDTCCFHLGNAPAFMQYTLDELHTFICRTLEILLKWAEELKITICIENIFKPLNTVSEILTLLKKFDSPYLGVCYDAGHANIMEKGMNFPDSRPWGQWEGRGDVEWESDVLGKLLPYIVNCHLHDNFASQDEHALPGKVSINWQQTIGMLKQAPRLKSMQSEVIPLRGGVSTRRLIETWESVLKNN